jgi:hypothetical protein
MVRLADQCGLGGQSRLIRLLERLLQANLKEKQTIEAEIAREDNTTVDAEGDTVDGEDAL